MFIPLDVDDVVNGLKTITLWIFVASDGPFGAGYQQYRQQ
jgi:hypothetical protein